LFFLLVPETLWNQDIDLDAAMNDQGEMMKGGRVGPAWLPWHRPKDFAALFWNPIAMVSSSNHDRCLDTLLMSLTLYHPLARPASFQSPCHPSTTDPSSLGPLVSPSSVPDCSKLLRTTLNRYQPVARTLLSDWAPCWANG
jgi:hypothetical protein